MPVSPTYPGVYVQEVPSGVRTIAGVATSIAMFIGRAKSGPIGQPVRCLNYSDFARTFGEDTTYGDLGNQMKLFFANGGTDCYVMRIAKGAISSQVDLENESGSVVLTLRAKDGGSDGDFVRASVTYGGPYPEIGFNMEVFRWQIDTAGNRTQVEREVWTNLSMDPQSPGYAEAILTKKSKLVTAIDKAKPNKSQGFSLAGRPVAYADTGTDSQKAAAFGAAWAAMFGTSAVATSFFLISVDGFPSVEVSLSGIDVTALATTDVATSKTALAAAVKAAITTALTSKGIPSSATPDVDFVVGPAPTAAGNVTDLLRITSVNNGNVLAQRAANKDAAGPLMLGQQNGGTEVGAYAKNRPAPTGLSFSLFNWSSTPLSAKPLTDFGGLAPTDITELHLDQLQPDGTFADFKITLPAAPGARLFVDSSGGFNGVREYMANIRDAVDAAHAANPSTLQWAASLAGSRLTFLPTGDDNRLPSVFKTSPTDIATSFTQNVRYYALGLSGTAGMQANGVAGSNGSKPDSSTYDDAYRTIDSDIDLFNLMVLPADAELSESERAQLWGPRASSAKIGALFLSWTRATAGIVT